MIEFCDVVVGLQHGDEAKGKVTHQLASSSVYTHCMRFGGSGNAGHTIYHKGNKIVTHQIPTGIISGLISIIGPGCVIDPIALEQEIQMLESYDIPTRGLLCIASNAHIITQNHIDEDRKDETIGTTKRGNGPAYRDKINRTGTQAKNCESLKPYIVDIVNLFNKPKEQITLLVEGAQGFGIDIDWGDYPYVTSGQCTTAGVIANGVPYNKIRHVYGVAKVYDTYVGKKQFELTDNILSDVFKQIREVGEEYGATTGRPRQVNFLDLDKLRRALLVNCVTHVVFNKTDVLEKVGCFKLYDLTDKLISFQNLKEMQEYINKYILVYSEFPNAEIITYSGNKESCF